jgi:hypothetical protein
MNQDDKPKGDKCNEINPAEIAQRYEREKEKKLIDLIAKIIVDITYQQVYEKGD